MVLRTKVEGSGVLKGGEFSQHRLFRGNVVFTRNFVFKEVS
jgi:hypothetical protein